MMDLTQSIQSPDLPNKYKNLENTTRCTSVLKPMENQIIYKCQTKDPLWD